MSLPILKSKFGLLLAAAALAGAVGCEDAAKHTVQVQPKTLAPSASTRMESPAGLPLDLRRGRVALLMAPVPDGIGRVIARSRAAFNAGELEFKAGHLDKAREQFDDALAQLFAGGFDVQSEPRLGDLYRQILDTIGADEMAAFRDGDAGGEPKGIPAPIDEIAEGALPQPEKADPNLRARAEKEVSAVSHDLPLTVNDAVLSFLNYFKTPRGSAIVETGLRRAGRYRSMVERVLREEGIPQDLIYLAQAESAFLPQAVSKAGARGMWQFMSFAGRKYGLEKSWWVDERQDPEKATHAAARDLKDLYSQFGDWYLSMAAYNSGAGTVQHAIERTGYSDFWELYRRNVLPKETQNYVPIILALTLVSKDPARYGIEFQPEPELKADDVKPGRSIDLRLVSEAIDTDVETLRALNPQLLRLVTPANPEFVLHLPEGTAGRFFSEISAIPGEKWVSWREHKVEGSESLSAIAKRYHVSTAQIAEANEMTSDTALEDGQKLIIPAAAHSDAAGGKMIRYRVRKNDTVGSIADEFDVTTAELRQWNRLKSDHVARGMWLKVHPGGMGPMPQTAKARETESIRPVSAKRASHSDTPVMEARSNSGKVVHRVKAGETLWSIAKAYQTTVATIRAGNRYLFSRPLQVGDTLTILSHRSFAKLSN